MSVQDRRAGLWSRNLGGRRVVDNKGQDGVPKADVPSVFEVLWSLYKIPFHSQFFFLISSYVLFDLIFTTFFLKNVKYLKHLYFRN